MTEVAHYQLRVLYYSPLAMLAGTLNPKELTDGGQHGVRFLIDASGQLTEYGENDGPGSNAQPPQILAVTQAACRAAATLQQKTVDTDDHRGVHLLPARQGDWHEDRRAQVDCGVSMRRFFRACAEIGATDVIKICFCRLGISLDQ